MFLRKNDVVAPNSRWFKRECKKTNTKDLKKFFHKKETIIRSRKIIFEERF
ncbi:hypothetical protein LEP1GSC068_3269 [Leptospira sp. Fiocruz LV3954]|nr:hypothetical protein LEP1GSC068_3269 [Leptospira sp. Fiocruz LV3954]EMI67902.1 hypothetical protein LEP1GSC076_1846 [Leptospira sp. Fiocruz LV4135]